MKSSPNDSQEGTQTASASHLTIPRPGVEVQGDRTHQGSSSSTNAPLQPAACAIQSDGQQLDPMNEFSEQKANLQAVDRCLDAACALYQFEIAEVRTETRV